jgi:hypothetical protein
VIEIEMELEILQRGLLRRRRVCGENLMDKERFIDRSSKAQYRVEPAFINGPGAARDWRSLGAGKDVWPQLLICCSTGSRKLGKVWR